MVSELNFLTKKIGLIVIDKICTLWQIELLQNFCNLLHSKNRISENGNLRKQIIIKLIEPRYSSLNPKTKPSTSRLRKITAVNFLILHKKIAYKRKHPGVSHKDLEL